MAIIVEIKYERNFVFCQCWTRTAVQKVRLYFSLNFKIPAIVIARYSFSVMSVLVWESYEIRWQRCLKIWVFKIYSYTCAEMLTISDWHQYEMLMCLCHPHQFTFAIMITLQYLIKLEKPEYHSFGFTNRYHSFGFTNRKFMFRILCGLNDSKSDRSFLVTTCICTCNN